MPKNLRATKHLESRAYAGLGANTHTAAGDGLRFCVQGRGCRDYVCMWFYGSISPHLPKQQ